VGGFPEPVNGFAVFEGCGQIDGKLLADRALSRLLKKTWPKTLEKLERWER